MTNANPVLVMKESGNQKTLTIEYLSESTVPETLNGESGFHVYHVRMLTELILKDLKDKTDAYDLTDDKIQTIAVAASLHDIGKMDVPKSILDFPGRLSSEDFEIVKKHSEYGENIIKSAKTDVDAEIIKHAKEIAKSHHERYDGKGYPDGLLGEDIPVSAQVVAIADCFDALTSERCYKEAVSQEVAIQMISGGQCGAFSTSVVQSLLNVVNHISLVQIRQSKKQLTN